MFFWIFLTLAALGATDPHVDMVPREMWIPEKVSRLKLPNGYKLEVLAKDLGRPRGLAVGGAGEIYVSRPQQGDILVLQTEKGGLVRRTLFSGFPEVSGLAWRQDKLYFIVVNRVYVADLTEKKPRARVLYQGLPRGGQHPRRSLAIGPDGFLYLHIGSTCNACIEKNPESATLIRAKLDGSERKIFATGLHSLTAFDWDPESKALYGMDQGIDMLGDDVPEEELNLIEEGKFYGWPFCYGVHQANPLMKKTAAESKDDPCAKSVTPLLGAVAHSAPLAMKFHWQSLFVAFHGSWNRSPPSGYKIQRVVFQKGKPARFEDFLTGFLAADGRSQMGRPAGLAIGKDGSLLIADDANGVLYAVQRVGR